MTKHKLINFSKSAEDCLNTLVAKQFKQVFSKILDLRNNPRPHDSIKLIGHTNKYRADVGEYRIIYSFDEMVVNIELIGKRNDSAVYKIYRK